MSFDLNELRAQRDKMREHLAWLDRQIAQLEGKPTPAQPLANEPAQPVLGGPKPAEAKTTPPTATTHAPTTEATPPPANHAPEAVIASDYKPGGFDGSSKIGCILAAILVAGLIIFLLFGLPQLLYPDAPQ